MLGGALNDRGLSVQATKIIIVLLSILPNLANSHGGRTDKSGCHNDRKNGGYHCHNGGSASRSQAVSASPSRTNSVNTLSGSENSTTPDANTVRPSVYSSNKNNSIEADTTLVLKIQDSLNMLGYSAGKADGVLGKQTVKAIKHFQVDNEMLVDGKPSYWLLDVLVKKVG